MKRAAFEDWPEINAAYDKLPSRVLRSERAWEKHFMRENYAWYIGGLNGSKAYAAVRDGENVTEIYGDAETAVAMLGKLFGLLERDELKADYFLRGGKSDELEQRLFDRAAYMQVSILSQIAIFDAPRFLKILEEAGVNTGAYINGGEELQARRLLRHLHHPIKEGCGSVSPLLAWIPDADNI